MTATQGNLAGMSRYVFRVPRWYTTLAFALVVAAVTGVGAFDTRFLLQDVWEGVFFVGVPTIVAAFLTSGVDRALGGRLTFGRSSLLALACELIAVVFLVVAGTIAVVADLGQNFVFDALFAGLGFVFAFRLLVILAVSRHRVPVAAIPASIQTVAAAVMLFVYSGTLRFLEVGGPLSNAYLSRANQSPHELHAVVPKDFLLLGAVCLVYGVAVVGFIQVIDRPWQQSLGVSALDLIAGFIGHVAEGTHELEDFFAELGDEAVVPVTVLAFRRPDGTEKARFILPMIHPGPMGEIGGGNLPRRVADQAEGVAFPPHATAGHDFNLVNRAEVDSILETAESAYEDIEFGEEATRSVRIEEGDAKLLGQAVGDDLLLVTTFSPNFTDDVDYAVGLTAAMEARGGRFDDVLLVDAHNCNDGLDGEDLGHVTPGSPRSFDMIHGAGEARDRLADAETGPMQLGVAWDETEWTTREGIGPLGVRVAVLDVAGQTTAYVLVDGNNMEPGLRERLVDTVEGVDAVEVMTTDTHVVNTVESVNQVGDAIDQDEFVALVEDLLAAALDDREPVEGGMASEQAYVTVFGNDRTETLASTANAWVSMGAPLAVAVTAFALAVSVLIFLFA